MLRLLTSSKLYQSRIPAGTWLEMAGNDDEMPRQIRAKMLLMRAAGLRIPDRKSELLGTVQNRDEQSRWILLPHRIMRDLPAARRVCRSRYRGGFSQLLESGDASIDS
jgi:hypothetical protein